MGKIRLRLKCLKRHQRQTEFCYKIKILGKKAAVTDCPDNGFGADFSKTMPLLLKSE